MQVVFKDKIINLDDDYRAQPNITSGDIYVADIFKLASHIIPRDQVKTMDISQILQKVSVKYTTLNVFHFIL